MIPPPLSLRTPEELDSVPEVEYDFHVPQPEPEVLTLRTAAERLIDCESRLDYANQDLEEAHKMYQDAQDTVNNIKAERNEAVKFLVDFAKELELNTNG